MEKRLVAPCGMNCAVCSGYLAWKHNARAKGIRMPYCEGCRPRNKQCAFLKKKCEKLLNGTVSFCYACEVFPCERLRHVDERYRMHFRMSLIENLEFIKERGMSKFLMEQENKWRCPNCGGVICCHNGVCFDCGLDRLKAKKKLHRWEE